MTADVEVAGQKYRVRKLNIKEQGRMARKLLPFLTLLIPFVTASNKELGFALDPTDLFSLVTPLGKLVSEMEDKDWDMLALTCMGAVTRASGQGYAPIWNTQVDQPLFTDIDFPHQVMLMGAVIKYNLGPFMAVLPTLSPLGKGPETPPL
jgi:hypothetical protein